MAATSFDRSAAWLGRCGWRRLHLAGGWVLWAIFAVSYLGRVVVGQLAFLPLALLVLAVLGLRVAAQRLWRLRTSPRPRRGRPRWVAPGDRGLSCSGWHPCGTALRIAAIPVVLGTVGAAAALSATCS